MTLKRPWHIVVTVVIGWLGYWAYYLYAMQLPQWMHWVEWTGIPWVSLAIGVFVGYRVGRRGWAFAMLPILLFLSPLEIAFGFRDQPTLWPFLFYKLPVGLLTSMFGGFIGEHLRRGD